MYAMAKKSENAADLIQALVPLIMDLVPLFLDKWAALQNRPRIKDLEDEISELKDETRKLSARLTMALFGVAVLFVWNCIFIVLFFLK